MSATWRGPGVVVQTHPRPHPEGRAEGLGSPSRVEGAPASKLRRQESSSCPLQVLPLSSTAFFPQQIIHSSIS